MMDNTIFIFEFVSGGGFNKVNIPISLFCEGYGMLRSIITDFKSLDFEIRTILDYRIVNLAQFLKVDEITIISKSDNFLKKFRTTLKKCKFIFIIAPESSDILHKLTKIAEKANRIVLSTNLKGIRLGTSKMNTYRFFKDNKITTPLTYIIPKRKKKINTEFIIQKSHEIKLPVVIKPEDGVGAESIYYFESQSQLNDFFLNFPHKLEYQKKYLIQKYIKGKDLSMSLIGLPDTLDSKSQTPLLLSINSQNINIRNSNFESEYYGGSTPIEFYEEIEGKLNSMLRKTNFLGISGYFGIDFIYSSNAKFYFIEINPRLTTSYIGVRNVINHNPAKIILNAKLNFSNNYEIKYLNHSIFLRLEMDYSEKFQNSEIKEDISQKFMKEIPEFVTPPISLNESNHYTSFIATKSKNLTESEKRINEIINKLEKFGFRNIKR